MVLGPHGVPGGKVPLRVVEEHRNVTERAQNQSQATEGRVVLGQQILIHNLAIAIIVQVRIVVLQRKPSTEHTRLHPCNDAIKPV